MWCLNPSKIRALWFLGLVGIAQCKEECNIFSICSCLPTVALRACSQAHRMAQAECDTCTISSLQTGWPCRGNCYCCKGRPSRNEIPSSWEAKELFGILIFALFPSSKGPSPALSSAFRLLSISAHQWDKSVWPISVQLGIWHVDIQISAVCCPLWLTFLSQTLLCWKGWHF